jgi:hypothetical protein
MCRSRPGRRKSSSLKTRCGCACSAAAGASNAIATDAERVLQDLDTVLLDVQYLVAGPPRRSADRRAAASLLHPSRLPRKGRSSPRKIGGIFAVASEVSTAPR